MTLRLNGSTSGYVEIDAPATAGSNTLVLPNSNGSNGQALTTNGSGTLSWATIPWSTSGNNIYYTTGSVSVGTTNAQGKLQVASGSSYASMSVNADDLIVENSGNCGITIASPTTSTGSIYFSDSGSSNSGSIVYNHSDDSLQFGTTSTERMRINSTGERLLNCTGLSGDAPNNPGSRYFQINGNEKLRGGTTSGTSADFLFQFYHGTKTTSDGSITVSTTGTAFNTTSDYRRKENQVAITDGIKRLIELKPYRFNFIGLPSHVVDGFFAHEVQDIVPEAITGEKDAVDDNGNPVYQGIDQSKLVPLLTAALQEAVERIEILEASNATLEARLTALEGGNP